MRRHNDTSTRGGCLSIGLLFVFCVGTFANAYAGAPTPSTDAVVAKLVAANQRRAQALRGYTGKRVYKLEYHGFLGERSAQLVAKVSYTPESKKFEVLSQSGSKLLLNRVLLKLLDSEKEAFEQQNRVRTELSPRNYEFSLLGMEHSGPADLYVLSVKPRDKSKFLYSGKIWVDAQDFAVTRMQGEPAKNPSMWISRTQIEYTWSKTGDFWLPSHNRSVSQIRMGGSAVLTIDYTDYEIAGSRVAGPIESDKSVLPDPSSVTPDQR